MKEIILYEIPFEFITYSHRISCLTSEVLLSSTVPPLTDTAFYEWNYKGNIQLKIPMNKVV